MGDRERIAQIIYYGAVLLVGYLSFLIFAPFLVPLGWGAVLAVCAYPVHTRLTLRVGRSQR
jgi:predicted PurR-regulated permease PerM